MLMAVSPLAVSRRRSAFASVFTRLPLSVDVFLQLTAARRGVGTDMVARPGVLPQLLRLGYKECSPHVEAFATLRCCITVSTHTSPHCRYDLFCCGFQFV